MKRTLFETIEVKPNGTIQVRFAKIRLDGSGKVDGNIQFHRTVFEPDHDIDAGMALVNAHLQQMGESQVEASCIDTIKAHAVVARTPEKVKAWAQVRAEQIAEAKVRAQAAEEAAARAEAAAKAKFEAAVKEAVAKTKG